MASDNKIIVLNFDGAGSNMGGFLNQCKSRLNPGQEITDLGYVLKKIATSTAYENLDLVNIGLMGSHYGAYLAMRALAKIDSDWNSSGSNKSEINFNCTLALSPISDWSKIG
jgi:hypothetical protein